MSGHRHGPRYKGPRPYTYAGYHAPRARRARRIKNILKYTGVGFAVVIFGPPILALGAAASIIALPVVAVKGLVIAARRKKQLKSDQLKMKKKMKEWAKNEKKRREDLGLPVSIMVEELASAQM